MWLPMRYMLLRLWVNMNVCCVWSLVGVWTMKRAWFFVLRIFGNLGSLSAKQMLFFGMYTLEPAMFPMPCSSSGMHEPSK